MKKNISIFVIMIMVLVALLQGNVFAAETLPEAVNGVITLTEDVELEGNVVIAKGETVVLDLNGHTISQSCAVTTGYSMIDNKGTLTIKDSVGTGKISFEDTGVGGNYVSNTIGNSGTLIVNGGFIENISCEAVAKNGYPHAIDTNGKLVINGGTVYGEKYSAIRVWCTTDDDTTVEINESATIINAVDMHNVNDNANKGTLTINGGTFNVTNGETRATTNSVRLVNFGEDYDEIQIIVKGGLFAGGLIVADYTADASTDFTKVLKVSGGKYTAKDFDVTPYLTDKGNLKVNSDGSISCAHKDGLTHYEGISATYTTEGKKEYWECKLCEKLFTDKDADAVNEVKDVATLVIPKLAVVTNNNAEVTTNAFDEAISKAEDSNSSTVIIPVLDTEETVTSVTVPVSSLTDVAEAEKELLIETSEVVVTLDSKTIEKVVEQSGTATNIKIEVAKVEDTALNEEQKESIKDKEVACIISAEIIANGQKISDFGGGIVKVEIPFTPEEGTTASDYKVIYIADDGQITDIETKYVDGALVLELEHFSEYAIVKIDEIVEEPKEDDKTEEPSDDKTEDSEDNKNDDSSTEKTEDSEGNKNDGSSAEKPEDNKADKNDKEDESEDTVQTGDNIALYISILGISVIGVAIIVKRKFSNK